jgi:putative transposase
MSHSCSQNLIHRVYSTEGPRNLIVPELQSQLWEFKSVIAKREGFQVIAAGGIKNHAHVLLAFASNNQLSKALQNLKAHSSRWIGEH